MIEILRQRRSIRKYLEKKIESEKVKILMEALLRSPSSKNINPWEFVFVDKKELIQKLYHCKAHGTTPLKTAPLAVIILADETKNDVWIEDCSIASILLQLTAQSLGLGSCWIQIRNRWQNENLTSEEYIQTCFKIPENYRILSIVTIGYPEKERAGKPFSELQFEKIKTNVFSE